MHYYFLTWVPLSVSAHVVFRHIWKLSPLTSTLWKQKNCEGMIHNNLNPSIFVSLFPVPSSVTTNFIQLSISFSLELHIPSICTVRSQYIPFYIFVFFHFKGLNNMAQNNSKLYFDIFSSRNIWRKNPNQIRLTVNCVRLVSSKSMM
jgi:hypothetical protein